MFTIIVICAFIYTVNSCSYVCYENGNHVNPVSVNSYIRCSGGQPSVHKCPVGGDMITPMIYDRQRRQCVESFRCPQTDGYFRHHYNDSQYYWCRSGVATFIRCAANQMFDGVSRCCQWFFCPALSGLFAHAYNTSQYWDCCYGQPVLRKCPYSHVFKGQTCIKVFLCPQPNGRFRVISNPYQYYECVDNRPHIHNCPQNTRFDGIYHCRPIIPVTRRPDPIPVTIEPPNYRCPTPVGVYPCTVDQSLYYQCWYSMPILRQCPERQVFVDRRCVNSLPCNTHCPYVEQQNCCQSPLVFQCPEPRGLFADPTNRMKYYQCWYGTASHLSCPAGTYFGGQTCVRPPIAYQQVMSDSERRIEQQNGVTIVDTFNDNKDQWKRRYEKTRPVLATDIQPSEVLRAPPVVPDVDTNDDSDDDDDDYDNPSNDINPN